MATDTYVVSFYKQADILVLCIVIFQGPILLFLGKKIVFLLHLWKKANALTDYVLENDIIWAWYHDVSVNSSCCAV